MKMGYGSVKLTDKFAGELAGALTEINITLPKHDFHCTVMYDERECPIPRCDVDPEKIFKATVIGVELLGDAIVFDLVSTDLLAEHMRLIRAGYKHSYDDFKAHMSIIYKPDRYDTINIIHKMNDWMGKEITFNEMTISDID